MPPECWKQVEKVFQAALDFPVERRDAFLDEACGDDAALRQQVEALVDSHDSAGSFIEAPAFAGANYTTKPDEPITVQLVSMRDGAPLWASRFDEKYTDILSLEDSLSAQVAEALVPHLTGEERERLGKRGTDSPEAFEAYLRGRYHWNTYTEEGLAKAIVYFNEAIAIDPSYAAAHAGVADYFNWLGVYDVLPARASASSRRRKRRRAPSSLTTRWPKPTPR